MKKGDQPRMKKLKIYLDSTVVSYLDQQDAPERMAETHKLWERIKAGEFDVAISSMVEIEINRCEEHKRKILNSYLNEIEYEFVNINVRTVEIASRFVDLNILRQKSFDDCQHIAAAIISGCDIILSWNFKHIVNHKTIMGVKAVTALEGYHDLLIYDPSIFTGGE
jgi:predicted nucleic acid-binding protein